MQLLVWSFYPGDWLQLIHPQLQICDIWWMIFEFPKRSITSRFRIGIIGPFIIIFFAFFLFLEMHLIDSSVTFKCVFIIAAFLCIGPVHWIFLYFAPQNTPSVSPLLRCGLFFFIWALCCDPPQTFKVCLLLWTLFFFFFCLTHTGNLTEPCQVTSVFPFFFVFLSFAGSMTLCNLSLSIFLDTESLSHCCFLSWCLTSWWD